jgi:hypothetical protein
MHAGENTNQDTAHSNPIQSNMRVYNLYIYVSYTIRAFRENRMMHLPSDDEIQAVLRYSWNGPYHNR